MARTPRFPGRPANVTLIVAPSVEAAMPLSLAFLSTAYQFLPTPMRRASSTLPS
jgi:hypothetical protein